MPTIERFLIVASNGRILSSKIIFLSCRFIEGKNEGKIWTWPVSKEDEKIRKLDWRNALERKVKSSKKSKQNIIATMTAIWV